MFRNLVALTLCSVATLTTLRAEDEPNEERIEKPAKDDGKKAIENLSKVPEKIIRLIELDKNHWIVATSKKSYLIEKKLVPALLETKEDTFQFLISPVEKSIAEEILKFNGTDIYYGDLVYPAEAIERFNTIDITKPFDQFNVATEMLSKKREIARLLVPRPSNETKKQRAVGYLKWAFSFIAGNALVIPVVGYPEIYGYSWVETVPYLLQLLVTGHLVSYRTPHHRFHKIKINIDVPPKQFKRGWVPLVTATLGTAAMPLIPLGLKYCLNYLIVMGH